MAFSSFIGLVLIAFLLALGFQARRARAATSAGDESPSEMKPARARQVDFLARASSELPESEWLRPEPSPSAARPDAGRAAQPGSRRDAPREPRQVEERATVVLRKQIPPRDEPPRSWIGGRPMMPEGVAWPRSVDPEKSGGSPEACHFICQIALADCHPDLWGGLGPREGWLLFFANSNFHEGGYHILHTLELGVERDPPADIGPIHDGTYTGRRTWTARESIYPRFPVDLVSMPNRTYERDDWVFASPADLDKLLNAGEKVGENMPWRGLSQPFTWGCVALAARAAVAAMDAPRGQATAARYRGQMRDKLLAPGGFEGILADKQADLDRVLAANGMAEIAAADPATLDASGAKRRAFLDEHREALAAAKSLLERYPDSETLLSFLDEEGEDAWRAEARSMLVGLADHAEERGRDSALGKAEWQAVTQQLASHDKTIWALGWGHSNSRGLPVTVVRRKLSILERLNHHMTDACADEAKRCYLDPALRAIVPAAVLPDFEAHLRSLDQNRPCRLGGYSDGVQHDVGPHPQGKLLLLQMACDYALEMLWGDCGAVYAFISPEDLAAGDLHKADIHLECH